MVATISTADCLRATFTLSPAAAAGTGSCTGTARRPGFIRRCSGSGRLAERLNEIFFCDSRRSPFHHRAQDRRNEEIVRDLIAEQHLADAVNIRLGFQKGEIHEVVRAVELLFERFNEVNQSDFGGALCRLAPDERELGQFRDARR